MFTGNEDHTISFENAGKLTKNYRNQMNPEDKKGGFFGEKAILTLLSQQDCVGIRYYYGLNEKEEKKVQVLVIVGVDKNENDLVGEKYVCFEMALPCPDCCSNDNILNSDI